ncbi:MAG: Rne/Rng family ribonuclease [Phycisphaerales bacterium]|nr:Rne/Rng family ribonuclease [Phycisphaerales bacterium]
MTDKPSNADEHTQSPSENPEASPETKASSKKTTKKTTKKPAAKKTTKKTTKKPAAKKTAKKKAAKKSTRKKTTKKAAAEQADAADEQSDEAAEDTLDQPQAQYSDEQPEHEDSDDADDNDGDEDDGAESDDDEQPRTRSRKKSTKRSSRKSSKRSSGKSDDDADSAPAPKATRTEMIVNYVPGEECRIAMVEDGKLEEFMVEPTDKVSRVGNIYVGRVANIEPAIQAAFVDFGTEENGFLHISDLHPQYFAKGDDKTERVGKKTPRKSRPPIQECLKKGQEIIVQVLKEGVGTKGPTLTSYLSIPGRFLVMMPGMDKVGVSRKEEDDDKRKAAKQILSQLELPDGFGFILRTAGFDRNKAELKRDLAYLARLWKDMETRRKKGNKPRLLYTESDLLVRSIRDLLSSEVDRVVIDSEPALKRVGRFIKIAAPRSGAKLSHYKGDLPIFHAFGLESQINEIHAREVMLPSGGRLVIDQTEALVAIDVNSGRSRAARDAETNAYQTNLEAVDAICRQLRLRDMGGLVVCDMIDMRYSSHRKQIEQRFNERLKRDRAKSTTAPISPFGLLEMTRQRMRGSMESQHFADCPICHGRGLVKKPDSVAATAIRDLAALLTHEKVHRAELVVNPRVASSLLSTKRASLTRIELVSGKALDVRVSESLPIDRVAFYAYDHNNNDIAIEKLKSPKGPDPEPSIVEWLDHSSPDGSWAKDPLEEVDETTVQKLAEEIARKAEQAEHAELPIEGEIDEDESIDAPKKKRRRRRRGGRGRGRSDAEGNEESGDTHSDHDSSGDDTDSADESPESTESSESSDQHADDGQPRKKRRRRRRRRGGSGGGDEPQNESGEQREAEQSEERRQDDQPNDEASEEAGEERPRRRPRRRPTPPRKGESEQIAEPKPQARSERKPEPKPAPKAKSEPKGDSGANSKPEPSEAPKKRRGLYSNSRRTLSASELAKLGIE